MDNFDKKTRMVANICRIVAKLISEVDERESDRTIEESALSDRINTDSPDDNRDYESLDTSQPHRTNEQSGFTERRTGLGVGEQPVNFILPRVGHYDPVTLAALTLARLANRNA